MSDFYDEKALELWNNNAALDSDFTREIKSIAAFGRESAADAYEDAARMVDGARLDTPDEPPKVWMHGFTVGKDTAAMMCRKAAALLRGQGGEKREEQKP